MMTTNVRNMRSIVTASSAVLVALLAVVVMLSAVSGVSADKSTTTTYETTKYVDEYNSGYYGEEYKSGYYPKYKWWAPWTWKYSSNKYNDNKYDSGYDSGYSKKKYGSGYSKYDSGYGYSKYDSKYGVGPYYGKQYEQDEHYPCDTFYPKPKWYSPFTWKYRKYAKFDYYSGPCEVKKEEHCLPFWGHPDDASEATWYTVTHASGGGGCHGDGCSIIGDPIGPIIGGDGGDAGGDGRRRQLLELSYPRPLYETQYFYAKSEAHGLTFTLTNHYYYNEKWVCAIDDISRKNAICTMAGHFGGGYSTPEKCILTFKTHQKGGKCIPHHMALDCGKPPYVETSKFSKIDYHLEECNTCDGSRRLVGTKYTSCDPEPFEGETITLAEIEDDIEGLGGDPTNVTITSFPCITDSSRSVDFDFEFGGRLPNLAEVRFANWVTGPTGPGGFFVIGGHPMLTSVDLSALKEAENVVIVGNQNFNFKKISLPSLTTTSGSFFVVGNPNLEKLCASELESVGDVCIGNNQPDLDADLSELVTGNVFDTPFCSDSNAPTVCGPDGGLGLFSSPIGRCPSNACNLPVDDDDSK
ncbi:Kin17_mid domain-containing protein [Pycnococcus provasolii]